MKGWQITGLVILGLLVVGGIAYGAYALGTSQAPAVTINTNTNSDTPSNTTPAKTVTQPTCNADELTLTTAEGDGPGAGSNSLTLVMTNSGSRECTLQGYPGVSLVNDNGNMIGSPADRASASTEALVTLTPGKAATSLVTYAMDEGDFDAGTCKDGATKLRVYPPNDAGYISVATTLTYWCPGFTVTPVVAQ